MNPYTQIKHYLKKELGEHIPNLMVALGDGEGNRTQGWS